MPSSLLIAQIALMFPVMEWVRAIWPVHLRHAIFAFEEIWQCQRTKVQAISCLWMSPYQNHPFGVQYRNMLGLDRQGTLCATKASWSEINPAPCRLRRRRR